LLLPRIPGDQVLLMQKGPPLALRPEEHAFFLDMDGTLLELAPQPEGVKADAALLGLLNLITTRSAGALALVTGRRIDALDRITFPYRFPASGVHGFERRDAAGVYVRQRAPRPQALTEARVALQRLVAAHPQLFLEDKQVSLALHYRAAAHLEPAALSVARALAEIWSMDFRVQPGSMVVELMPRFASKATAVTAFMEEPPFKGRTPVYVGDDLTDEPAFQLVNAAGGVSVAVTSPRPTAALTTLPSVAAVRAWLLTLISHGTYGRCG
jgi:trehalose 6-phosphate phosphatase